MSAAAMVNPYLNYSQNNYGYGNMMQTHHNTTQIRIEDIRTKFRYDGILFEDQSFPANESSLIVPGGIRRNNNILWKRPVELMRNPKFFADGVSRFDVIQGELGNCWFIAAVANLTIQKNYFYQVVPSDNSFNLGQYCGAFHFRFWQYGDWIDIVVDDRLPCNSRGEILYMHSQDKNEFWSALLEKAYAKLHGSYGSLSGGTPSEAMQDFTGGIVEMIDVKEMEKNLFRILKKAFERNSLMTCALANSKSGYKEEKTATGLVRGHAYSITSVQEIRISQRFQAGQSGLVQLIRVRNPWGDNFEWNGAWSDMSREWEMVDSATKASLEWSRKSDGEFWMSIRDLQQQFDRVEICHLGPDPVNKDASQNTQQWDKSIISGAWSHANSTAGGCINNHDTYARNPQYIFNFAASGEDGDADKCTVVVSLIQKEGNRTDRKKYGGKDSYHIGFRIYRIPPNFSNYGGRQLDSHFFQRNCHGSFSSGSYTNTREVSARFELPPGSYCIVPTTFNPNEEGEFLLRIYSEPQSPSRFTRPVTGNTGLSSYLDGMFSKLTLNSDKNGGQNNHNAMPANALHGYIHASPSYGPGSTPNFPLVPSYGPGPIPGYPSATPSFESGPTPIAPMPGYPIPVPSYGGPMPGYLGIPPYGYGPTPSYAPACPYGPGSSPGPMMPFSYPASAPMYIPTPSAPMAAYPPISNSESASGSGYAFPTPTEIGWVFDTIKES